VRTKPIFLLAATVAATLCAGLFLRSAFAQGGGGAIARAQFRGTGGSSDNNPIGTMILTEDAGKQVFRVQLNRLFTIKDLSIYVDTNSFYDGTNSPVFVIAPLKRTDIKKGKWAQTLTGIGGAPDEFQLQGVANLSDLSDLRSIVIGNPGITNIIGGTNFVNCIQTVVSNTTIITCTTNIVGGATNIFINAFAWAPVPPLVVNPSAFTFHKSFDLQQPAVPPDPHAKGKVVLAYNGSTGRSLLDISLNGLIPGQGYTLWLSDGGTNYASNVFPLTKGGSKGLTKTSHLRLDTGLGDPLPIQVSSTADLTGRVFSVQDATGFVYLFGSLP
jgi:hypothetical protein